MTSSISTVGSESVVMFFSKSWRLLCFFISNAYRKYVHKPFTRNLGSYVLLEWEDFFFINRRLKLKKDNLFNAVTSVFSSQHECSVFERGLVCVGFPFSPSGSVGYLQELRLLPKIRKHAAYSGIY